jgi:hypothetical protein
MHGQLRRPYSRGETSMLLNLEVVHSGVTAEAHKRMAQAVIGKVAPPLPARLPDMPLSRSMAARPPCLSIPKKL